MLANEAVFEKVCHEVSRKSLNESREPRYVFGGQGNHYRESEAQECVEFLKSNGVVQDTGGQISLTRIWSEKVQGFNYDIHCIKQELLKTCIENDVSGKVLISSLAEGPKSPENLSIGYPVCRGNIDISQLLKTSGLLQPKGKQALEWWAYWRKIASSELMEMARDEEEKKFERGQKGEWATFIYEHERGRIEGADDYVSRLNSNAGYDIRSRSAGGIERRIEVKASALGVSEANFSASRAQCGQAEDCHSGTIPNEEYLFYLWLLEREGENDEQLKLFAKLSYEDICPHLPEQRGAGRWKAVDIPFKIFEENSLLSLGIKYKMAEIENNPAIYD